MGQKISFDVKQTWNFGKEIFDAFHHMSISQNYYQKYIIIVMVKYKKFLRYWCNLNFINRK